MSDYPYTKESHILDQTRRFSAELLDLSKSMYGMRQLSVATVISAPDDRIVYKINIINAGSINKSDAYLLAHPNYWNIVGYPGQDDTVLIMHQRNGGDAHIIMKLQDKSRAILEQETVVNHDGLTCGSLQP